jgi:hypothetical protein
MILELIKNLVVSVYGLKCFNIQHGFSVGIEVIFEDAVLVSSYNS